jgi:hypothetical protein
VSVFPTGIQLREALFGLLVSGASKTIPQTTTQTVFNVSGGRILLTSLLGIVSVTPIGGAATTLSVGVTPTGGASAPTALATATAITSSPVGTTVLVPPAAGALVVGGASGVLASGLSGAFYLGQISQGGLALVSAGVITVTTNASTTGAITWSITYMPYDQAAVVTAA